MQFNNVANLILKLFWVLKAQNNSVLLKQCSELNAHFSPIFEAQPTVLSLCSMAEPPITTWRCVSRASPYKKFTGTVSFGKLSLKYFSSYMIFIFITKFNFLMNRKDVLNKARVH